MHNVRWLVLVACTGVMTMLGTLYSWSLFSEVLSRGLGWPHTVSVAAFSCAVFFVGLGAMVGGRWQDKAGPRAVTLTGVALWGAGNLLAGIGTVALGPFWLYLTYGVIGGFGVGLGYVTPVTTAIKWFPDRPGLAGGIVAMGFGSGSIVYNLLLSAIPSLSNSAASGATVVGSHDAVRAALDTLTWSGVVLLALGCACAQFVTNPPAHEQTNVTRHAHEASFTTAQMLHTPQFFLLWLMFFANVAAGILLIANVLPIMQEQMHATPRLAARVYAATAVANAAGRFVWGCISDKIGLNSTFIMLFAVQAIAFFFISGLHELSWLACAFGVIFLCFGGGFGVMPSFNRRYFGSSHLGANYGVLLTAWGCAGIAGPLMAARIADIAGSFSQALRIEALLLVAAMLLPCLIRAPHRSRPERDVPSCPDMASTALPATASRSFE